MTKMANMAINKQTCLERRAPPVMFRKRFKVLKQDPNGTKIVRKERVYRSKKKSQRKNNV